MMSGPHRKAMPKLADWCSDAAVVHWYQDDSSPPGWKEAHRKLLSDGRRSKVRWPSPNHDAFIIPPPSRRPETKFSATLPDSWSSKDRAGRTMKSILILTFVIIVNLGVTNGFAQSRGGRSQGRGGTGGRGGYPASDSVQSNGTAALDYFKNGSSSYIKGDYKLAIEAYSKALELEKKKPTLDKMLWYVLIDNLGLSYEMTTNLKKEKEIFEYGLSQDSTYPLFYYNLACAYAEMGDLDQTISNLKLAFANKANAIPGDTLPNPANDDRLVKLRKNDRFVESLKELE
jgi:hypothetical protein